MNTLATVFEVWVPAVTLLAITTVPRPVFGIRTCGIPSTYIIRFVLSNYPRLVTNCPIKNHGRVLPKSLWLNWHLLVHIVLGGLGGKGFELRG